MRCIIGSFAFIASAIMGALILTLAPVHWQDEVQINEQGRKYLAAGDTDWDMQCSSLRSDKGLRSSVFYVSSVQHEIAYRLCGHLGPRMLSFGYLVVFAMLLWRYAHIKLGGGVMPILLALLVLSLPHLRVGRLEPEVFAYLFAVLNLFTLRNEGVRRDIVISIGAGFFATLCLLSWPTAIVLIPILADAIFLDSRESRGVWQTIWFLCLFGLFTTLIVVSLEWWQIVHWRSTINLLKGSAENSAQIGSGFHPKDFLRYFAVTPYVYLLGGFCLLAIWKRIVLVCGGLGFLALCVVSRVYEFRMIYFLPFALLAIIYAYNRFKGAKVGHCLLCLVALMAVVSISRNLVVKSIAEISARKSHDMNYLLREFDREIGKNSKVYCHTFNTYYIGRSLGWRQWQLDFQNKRLNRSFLEDKDYFVIEEKCCDAQIESLLKDAGFDNFIVVKCPREFIYEKAVRGASQEWGPYRIYKH